MQAGNRPRDESHNFSDSIITIGGQSLSGDWKVSIANLSVDEGQNRLGLSRRSTASVYTSSLTRPSSYLSTKNLSPSSRPSAASVSKYRRKSGSAYSSEISQSNSLTSGHTQSNNDIGLSMIYKSYILDALVDFNPVRVVKDLNEFAEKNFWIGSLKKVKVEKTLNRHWVPIFSLCYPCAINPFILVKQETFAHDVEFALQQLGVERSTYDYITLALYDHRAELSLPSIIVTLFHIAIKPAVQSCLGFVKFTRRIWISLQIQGFIDEKIEFPVEKFSKDQFSNGTYFTEIVLQTLRDYPMSSSQSNIQGQEYLYCAYRSVKPETLRRVQDLYKQDFEMFGYSKLPPTNILTRQT
ncbi:uncharacterized protein LOC128551029 [Mercenaria mercenaria]|uniref:uncharacterized protein LOC128551029 n=1 Tax=Mercenaria mercenaria TaxID=6596 RepID=UPI00234E6807|nr:uncharacterized protein LOC128551029 [Mercenaria mercenaria]